MQEALGGLGEEVGGGGKRQSKCQQGFRRLLTSKGYLCLAINKAALNRSIGSVLLCSISL